MPAISCLSVFAPLDRFMRDERGAVVVDWVLLAAGLVGLAVAIGVSVSLEAVGHAEEAGVVIEEVGDDL